MLVRLADGVEEVLGQERLGFLGVLDRVAHPVEELVELLPLLFELLAGLLALLGVAERLPGAAVPGVELLGELVLVLVEPPRLVAHLGHFLGEPVRGVLAELLAEVVQLPAGAGAFGDGLGEPAFLERLGGLADVFAALLDLLAGVGHAVAVLLALHPLAELVGVAEDLLLLVAEPLELPLELGACLRVLGGFEGRLDLLEAIVQVALPLGQLAEAVEHLPVLALLAFLLRLLFLLARAERCSS